jgi:DNA-binding transcriptional regulator PaaX
LIEKEVRERNSIWKITKSGRAKLKALKEKSLFSPATILYRKRSDTELKIIIFDIPEMERKKRTWLRQALRTLEFNMLQRSVWVGKKKIPKEFLRDLNERDLLPYVHVFAVNKTGTIRTVQ